MNVAGAQHVVESRERLRSLGEYYGPSDGSVKAMHHTEKDVAGLCVALLDEGLDCFGERSVAGLVALDNLTGALVDDDYVVVLI